MDWRWKWQEKKFSIVCCVILFCTVDLAVAQHPTFDKKTLILHKKPISAEIADDPDKQAYGLMNRKSLGENSGMLFIFEGEAVRVFWMKNTLIDLSIGFFDSKKKLVDIKEMTAGSLLDVNPPTYQSAKPAQFALEMNKGWFKKNNIKIGETFQFKDQK